MANIKSQIKRNRQNEERRVRNKGVRSEMKTRTKSAIAAVGTDDEAAALRLAIKRIDKSAARGRHPQEPGGEPQITPHEARQRPAHPRLTGSARSATRARCSRASRRDEDLEHASGSSAVAPFTSSSACAIQLTAWRTRSAPSALAAASSLPAGNALTDSSAAASSLVRTPAPSSRSSRR